MDDCIRVLKSDAPARDQIVAFLVGNVDDTGRRIDLADHLSAIDDWAGSPGWESAYEHPNAVRRWISACGKRHRTQR